MQGDFQREATAVIGVKASILSTFALALRFRRLEYEERNKKKEVKEMAAYEALQRAQAKS